MSESTGEAGDIVNAGNFQVGDSITAFAYPLTEGLIIARQFTEETKLELTFIVAPYKKRGHTWARAQVISRDAAKLSKKVANNFTFPIKNVEVLRLEARNAKGDSAWAFATCVALDRDFYSNSCGSGASESEIQEEEDPGCKDNNTDMEGEEEKQDLISTRVEEVIQLSEKKPPLSRKIKEKKKSASSVSDLENVKRSKKHRKGKKKKKDSRKKKVSSSSDSDSSSSSSDSSRTSGEVGEKGKSGRFTCPFDEGDNRGFKDSKRQIRGQSVIRKHVRVALHNLYAEHNTMKGLADALISQANASPFKPFATDKSWLIACARFIDTALLRCLEGPWKLWDEPLLDDLVMSFLELVVRVSPEKEYPLCLDDSVRKWMKKKRVGANPKYGPVSYAMQHAQFTDCGPLLFQAGWQKQRERNFGRPSATASPQKAPQSTYGGSEKKPPPPAHTA